MFRQRIIIKDIDRPREEKVKQEVKWICQSLGFTSGRDIEDTSFKIVYQLLGQFKNNEIVPTESIARSLRMDSPTVNHHIRNLMESGIVFREKRKVALRGGSLAAAIEEMKRDSDKMFERIMEVAKKIDGAFD